MVIIKSLKVKETGWDFLIAQPAIVNKKIHLHSSLDSSKDYVDVDSVTNLMCRIAKVGKKRIYNVASGYYISNREIVIRIRALTGCVVTSADDAPMLAWPLIDNHRIRQEFDFKPVPLMDKLEDLINKYKATLLKKQKPFISSTN